MTKRCYIISLLLFVLAATVVQGQHNDFPASESAELPLDMEPSMCLWNSSNGNCTYIQLTKNVVGHRGQHDLYSWLRAKIGIPANKSIAALLSTGGAQVIEGFYTAVNYTMEQASGCPNTMTPERRAEIELIAAMAGIRYEEVSALALILEGSVRWMTRLIDVVSEITVICVHYLWRRLLLGFWPGKLAIGSALLFWGRAQNVGMGKCRLVVGYVVAFLLVGPVCELVDTILAALERWLLYV